MFKSIRVLLLAVASLISLGANATTYNFGPVANGVNVLGTHNVPVGAFSDTINFSLPSAASLSGSASSFHFNVGPTSIFDIAGLSLGLYTSGGTLLGSGLNFTIPGIQSAGNYYLQITGTGTGLFGGLYSAGLNVSPAPEPETWAMMLGGLGLVARVARRRKTVAPVVA